MFVQYLDMCVGYFDMGEQYLVMYVRYFDMCVGYFDNVCNIWLCMLDI